ncbi:hypothetical protein W02_17040 [Nitrospira sp. KM1]|uniref:hypothetical protein n=1 Tax=Nitrospira sp. KM1 TaxID=1936990 RepID=UPI0013A7557D|nr:hypothetical protein [Nitrospira sp. KM1]BCA54564.1 hypothetical protein W02_17040 [Nitrospira sp. KM1]
MRPGKTTAPQSVGGRVQKATLRLKTLGAHRLARPSATVALIILRAADLAAALPAERRVAG